MQEITLSQLRSTPAPPPTLTLSWQSLALAILLTAIPTILHPCGLAFGSLRTYSKVLRCSPVACAVSAIDAVSKIAAFSGRRLRDAAEGEDVKAAGFDEFIKSRYPESCVEEKKEGRLAFTSMRPRRFCLCVFFLFVSLPQAIKVCASSGPLWLARFACVAYAITFAFDEIVMEFATRRQGRTHALVLSEDDLRLHVHPLHFVIEGVYITAPMLLNVCRAQDYVVEYGMGCSSTSGRIGFGRLPLSVILAQLTIFGHNIAMQQEDWMRFLRDDEPKVLILVSCFHCVLLVGSAMVMTGTNKMYDLGIGGGMVVVALLCTFAVLKIVERLARSSRGRFVLHVFLGVYFVLVQVVAALLYFANGYDEAKLSTPMWTRYLELDSWLF